MKASTTIREETTSAGKKKGRHLALKFLSGKFVGGIFPLPDSGKITMGRGSEADVAITEEMVSRIHARLVIEKGKPVVLEDMESTNGTFLNGERIQKAVVSEGDRILIGTSIMKLMTIQEELKPSITIPPPAPADDAAGGQAAGAEQGQEPSRTRETKDVLSELGEAGARETSFLSPSRTMEGLLSEIPLMDLLQMFTSSKKSGILNVQWENATANVYLKAGAIVYVTYNNLFDMPSRKALFRILTLDQGRFTMHQYADPPEFAELLDDPTEFLLMEGLRQLDELHAIEKEAGLRGTTLQFSFPLLYPLKQLSAEELDIFQVLNNPISYEYVLDLSPYEDLATARLLKQLLDKKYVKKEP